MAQQAGPSLLGIPPELRNRIYDEVLVQPRSISLRYHGDNKQPPLLSVCRAIRSEAIGIYYNDNNFFLEACKCRGAFWLPFCKLLAKYRKDGKAKLPTYICHHRGYLDEDNLWAWLKAYHQDMDVAPCPDHATERLTRASRNLVVRMFGVVKAMREKKWGKVKKVLGSFFEAVGMLEEMRGPMA
ncbi:hypothetical protein Slin15195_G057280 [Septoria linicola]|uniref:2EXR domain-containing protein n=1 Tax=Septoria linicola TaxID=215465 RepID=A0A9Q9EJN6_9PEZI|nr:hypothetical protein Slin14017_G073150 [Septoria linicola]USW52409.1 hypothetical protein Slin15195_G057280 [Septoria linicola]